MSPCEVWIEFAEKLAAGTFRETDCEPIEGTCFGLFIMEDIHAAWRDQIAKAVVPPYEFGEDKLIFYMDEGTPQEIRFDFVERRSRWLLYFIDATTIPIMSIDQLPYNDFPLPRSGEGDVGFGLWEELISFKINVYKRVKEDKGIAEALSWLADGFGKRVATSAWCPYFEPRKGFVVLSAWTESRHYGQDVSIERFGDDSCVLAFRNHVWFKMYDTATQFRSQIGRAEYAGIFEFIWKDRATRSGWDAAFLYDGVETRVIFTKRDGSQSRYTTH
jgi:hypothetical protein